mmetsp:Transcript_39508/g.29180  ORF Transcript_39508/g.29180 Transcript_39508/m.29180 type:complete len:261 (-) Transcript_39508:598-1380(-)
MFLELTIIIRIAGLVKMLLQDQNILLQDQIYMFFFFEVPFAFLINAAIVQLFLWMKFAALLYSKNVNDIDEIETDHNKFRVFMLAAVNFSTLCLTIRLISIIIPTMNPDLKSDEMTGFETAMNIILILIYAAVTIAYIPLFAVAMYKVKKDYQPLYLQIKWKMYISFVVLMLFLLLRLFIYVFMSVKSASLDGIENVTLNQEVPFFVSEVIITFGFSYLLFFVGQDAKKNEAIRQREEMMRMNYKLSMEFKRQVKALRTQ